ncbi:hypothetical protein M0R45_009104 [Rubus argutus]|uniref:Uncharacterized protein n=1 Tax=Rubus argutus TaxID=59490 RepID=A0AAW1Y6H8_RUBAR
MPKSPSLQVNPYPHLPYPSQNTHNFTTTSTRGQLLCAQANFSKHQTSTSPIQLTMKPVSFHFTTATTVLTKNPTSSFTSPCPTSSAQNYHHRTQSIFNLQNHKPTIDKSPSHFSTATHINSSHRSIPKAQTPPPASSCFGDGPPPRQHHQARDAHKLPRIPSSPRTRAHHSRARIRHHLNLQPRHRPFRNPAVELRRR